jgi:hypothetical protein
MISKYLYGASVQGIQEFIFKTNKLAEIVGASEIVEQICTDLFAKTLDSENVRKNVDILQTAAGNIKCIFHDEESCKKFVRTFPRVVNDLAPGITLSQAVVLFSGENTPISDLELKLKSKRNKLSKPSELGFMGLERFRRTDGVAFSEKKGEKVDEATFKKIEFQKHTTLFSKISGIDSKLIDIDKQLALDIKDISASGNNSWIAVIHADGNGLGQILQSYGEEIAKGKTKVFSQAIEDATKKAVQKTFNEIIIRDNKSWGLDNNFKFPIRPIILGGDDLTIIIRADLALDFTNQFLINFEETSAEEFKELGIANLKGLTACAGIAYINDSYPLHYALHLAEELCANAKKKVKKDLIENELPKSALSFYKVQESFIEDLDSLRKRTLESKVWDFYAGPYLLEDIKELKDKLDIIKELKDKLDIIRIEADSGDKKTKAIGKLRQIISESYKDKSTTKFMLKRMKDINGDFYNKLKLNDELLKIDSNEEKTKPKSQILDLITLHSFNYGDKNN